MEGRDIYYKIADNNAVLAENLMFSDDPWAFFRNMESFLDFYEKIILVITLLLLYN